MLCSQFALVSLELLRRWKFSSDESKDSKGSAPVNEGAFLVKVTCALLALIEELDLRASTALIAQRLGLKAACKLDYMVEWHVAPNIREYSLLEIEQHNILEGTHINQLGVFLMGAELAID